MKNLAGNEECDQQIKHELTSAGIDLINYKPKDQRSEVPWGIVGRLGPFIFKRAWYYYVVTGGRVPLYIAQEIYAHDHGKSDVRANGHCMAPPPHEQLEWFDEHGNELIFLSEEDQRLIKIKDSMLKEFWAESLATKNNRRVVDKQDRGIIGKPYVTLYHIDTQEGLNLFVQTINKYGLV